MQHAFGRTEWSVVQPRRCAKKSVSTPKLNERLLVEMLVSKGAVQECPTKPSFKLRTPLNAAHLLSERADRFTRKQGSGPPAQSQGTASGSRVASLSGGGQAASSRGVWSSSLAPSFAATASAASVTGSPSSVSGASAAAKRITSGTQASARSRTSTSVM